jgi:hypothetical protein
VIGWPWAEPPNSHLNPDEYDQPVPKRRPLHMLFKKHLISKRSDALIQRVQFQQVRLATTFSEHHQTSSNVRKRT